jgi:hypothetical protein
MMPGNVYIVHHIDTEGPLYESAEEALLRIERLFGVSFGLRRNIETLEKLKAGRVQDIDSSLSESVCNILKSAEFKKSWEEIDEMLLRILSTNYRKRFCDSLGNSWIYNWHIVDHVGFVTNKRQRHLGYLSIFDHYTKILKDTCSLDKVYWHFHPISLKKEAHFCATSYENSMYELHQSLSRRLIERRWFPKVHRAGFHTERPDSNWFLEQWIPFDVSNQSIDEDVFEQSDNMNHRFGDWYGAPKDWSVYHPDLYDWRKEGHLKRYIARCLNLNCRFRTINEYEIEQAFKKAMHENVYLGVTNHDFREISSEIEKFYNVLQIMSLQYPKIKYIFSDSLDAFRSVIGMSIQEIKRNRVEFELSLKDNCLKVSVINGKIFGAQPYLAIKAKNGEYFHDNMDFGDFPSEYYYTFDYQTLELNEIEQISIASNDSYGNTCIAEIKDQQIKKYWI